jgi:hypothetical protein
MLYCFLHCVLGLQSDHVPAQSTGAMVGGSVVGTGVGSAVGTGVGCSVGCGVGLNVGVAVGCGVGTGVGVLVGDAVHPPSPIEHWTATSPACGQLLPASLCTLAQEASHTVKDSSQ